MKSYDYPLMKVVRFHAKDIITTSGDKGDDVIPSIPTRDPETHIPMGGTTSMPD